MMKPLAIVLVFFTLLISTLGGYAAAPRQDAPVEVFVVQSDSAGMVLAMAAPAYQIERVSFGGVAYDQVAVPGAESASSPGLPQVPLVSALIGVPPEAEVQIEILADFKTSLPGRYRLPPAPTQIRQGESRELDGLAYLKDQALYTADAPYPAAPVYIAEEGWLRDQRIVRLVFAPIQYNPASGDLVWHRDIQVHLAFIHAGDRLGPARENRPVVKGVASTNPFEALLADHLLNYQDAKKFRSLPALAPRAQFDSYGLQSPGLKITVDQDGLYRLSYADLLGVGMDVTHLDPRNFHLTSQGQDVAIAVQGGADGVFDSGDYITFYGERFRGDRLAGIYAGEDSDWLNRFVYYDDGLVTYWDPKLDAAMFEKYTAENVYWLAVDDTPGLRMETLDGTPGSAEIPGYYWDIIHREESKVWWSWHYTSVDTWFWGTLKPNVSATPITATYTATLTALATGVPTATVRGEVVARNFNHLTFPDHHTQVYINDDDIPIDDATWDGHVRYRFDSQAPVPSLLAGENQLHFVAHKTDFMTSDSLYFDWFEIEYPREFQALEDQLDFTTHFTGTYRYRSEGFSDPVVGVYDLTSPLTPTQVLSPTVTAGGSGTYTVTFQTTHPGGARYLVAAVGVEGVVKSPASITPYTPPDFESLAGADYIVITHSDFLAGAQRLADYRSSQGYTALVVDVAALYDAFNFGIYHPIAIKNFLRYAFVNWEIPPAYAVLVGDGHWDLRSYQDTTDRPVTMPPFLAFVDPWQGEVDSANTIANLVGPEGDPLPDLAIGRIPVEDAAEMDLVIDKIIAFETAGSQDWQRSLLFVADNTPDSAGDFVASSEGIIQDHIPAGYQPVRIYQDDYGCSAVSSPECAAVRHAITTTLNITGALFVNFTGHGDIGRWSGERILRTNEAELLTLANGDRLPIFIDMTCLTGYWIYPSSSTPSLAVELLTLENAGAVAAFSPTGLGVAQGHDVLNRGFYDAVFQDSVQTLGWAAVAAKLDVFQAGSHFDLIHTFTVFGDPALRIPVTHFLFLPLIHR